MDGSQFRLWLIDIKVALVTQGTQDPFLPHEKIVEPQVTLHEKFKRIAHGIQVMMNSHHRDVISKIDKLKVSELERAIQNDKDTFGRKSLVSFMKK
jgi:hypothetical protein